ncbi:MAG: adenylyltransferase/cytidyltransferase family protein, partial [Defluviitoga tunisiensis]
MKKVYLAMTGDIIHHGHINIISEARKYGEVIVGLLTDEAIASYKRIPLLNYEERKKIVENIKGVSQVIPQKTLDYTENLEMIKPDYVIHGNDWREGIQKSIREKVIETLKKWDGELIEVEYTKGVSGSLLDEKIKKIGTTPEIRLKKLRRLIELKPFVRVIEASNGLTGLIAENTKIVKNGQLREFDAMWV